MVPKNVKDNVYDWITNYYLSIIKSNSYSGGENVTLLGTDRDSLYKDKELRKAVRNKFKDDSLRLAYAMKLMFSYEHVKSATLMVKRVLKKDSEHMEIKYKDFNGVMHAVPQITVEVEWEKGNWSFIVHGLLIYDAPVALNVFIKDLCNWNRCTPNELRIDGGILISAHMYATNVLSVNSLTTTLRLMCGVKKASMFAGRYDSKLLVGCDDILLTEEMIKEATNGEISSDDFIELFYMQCVFIFVSASNIVKQALDMRSACNDYATSVYYIDGMFEGELHEEVRQRMKGGGY